MGARTPERGTLPFACSLVLMVFSQKAHKSTRPARHRTSLRTVSALGTLALVAGAFVIPVNYVTEQPGPTFNTIGEYRENQLIEIEGAETYPVSGNLDMTTVSVAGGPNSTVGALGVLSVWLDDSTAVLPSDLMYPPTVTSEQVSQQNAAEMTNSQEVAQSAALTYLGEDFVEHLRVSAVAQDGPSAGLVEEADTIRRINGTEITGYQSLTAAINASPGEELTLTVERDGSERDLRVTPVFSSDTDSYILGLYLARSFDFPLSVNYGLQEVGGPSAGMMFALGIIDELTEGEMTGGLHFAGTGTITTDGEVGSIGGIAQKMRGSVDAGASVFLAPAENCDEVVGKVPEGLSVVKVSTLTEAVDAVTEIGRGADPATFPTCS